jgi:hypothetical protein
MKSSFWRSPPRIVILAQPESPYFVFVAPLHFRMSDASRPE